MKTTHAALLADAKTCLRDARVKLAKLERAAAESPSDLADLRVHHARVAVNAWAADVARLSSQLKR